jgi:hypothetical protein
MLQNATQGKTYPLLAALALTFWVAPPARATPGNASGTNAAPPPTPALVAPASLPFKLPPGTRRLAEDAAAVTPAAIRYTTSTGLGEATRFLERQLSRAGIPCERIGPYRVRGIEVTRFVSQQASTPWLAIHVVRKEGRTFLDIVARSAISRPSAR